jgi:hypothetical protein
MISWFEDLPEQCPEADAKSPNGEIYYRLTECEIVSCNDFWSHRKIWPHRAFKTTECRARSLSIFENISDCAKLLLLPLHQNKHIAEIILTPDAGVLKQTGKVGHNSWWRSNSFDPVANAKPVKNDSEHE